jgi:hypothetical protein
VTLGGSTGFYTHSAVGRVRDRLVSESTKEILPNERVREGPDFGQRARRQRQRDNGDSRAEVHIGNKSVEGNVKITDERERGVSRGTSPKVCQGWAIRFYSDGRLLRRPATPQSGRPCG